MINALQGKRSNVLIVKRKKKFGRDYGMEVIGTQTYQKFIILLD